MKKIGILTFHYAENYGAFLQAYALEKWLINHTEQDVEIVDYRPSCQIKPYKIAPFKSIRNSNTIKAKLFTLIDFFFELPYRIKKRIRYKKARKSLKLSNQKFFSNNFSLKNYNVLVLGSDQIWNPEITNGLDKSYFGFNADNNCKKISYAASCGVSNYEDYDYELRKMLNNIDNIGVREQDSVDLLKKFTNNDIIVNADPTLLIGRDFWLENLISIKERNYILVYMLSDNGNIMNDAIKLSKQTGKKILHFRSPGIKKNKNIKSLSFAGPFDFISYIYNADYVLTDSFHATCFSVMFKKNFYTYLGIKRSERLLSLASMGKFEERLIEFNKNLEIKELKNEDYYLNLIDMVKESEKYLLNGIGE